MKRLKEHFKKNGLAYSLIQRNDVAALYGVSGNYTNNILHYEVCRIHIRSDKYGIREVLPTNEQFGREGSQAILDKDQAIQCFNKLTASLKSIEEPRINTRRGRENLWECSSITELLLPNPCSGNKVKHELIS